MLSGDPETRIAVQAMKQGAITVLEKPCHKDDLLRALARVFAELEGSVSESIGLPKQLPDGQLCIETLSRREGEIIDPVY